MTRARDSLHIYAREGTGKVNKTRPAIMRELIEDKTFLRWLSAIPASGTQTTLDMLCGGRRRLSSGVANECAGSRCRYLKVCIPG